MQDDTLIVSPADVHQALLWLRQTNPLGMVGASLPERVVTQDLTFAAPTTAPPPAARGGSWAFDQAMARAANRGPAHPALRSDVGVRVVVGGRS